MFEEEQFPGEIPKIESDTLVSVKCMTKGKPIGSVWRWPDKDDLVVHYDISKLAKTTFQMYGKWQH